MRATGLIIFICLFTMQLAGQVPTGAQAGVHTISGVASVVRNGKQVYLKQGDYILNNDRITVRNGAFLTLVTRDLRFIQVRKPGSYLYADLVKGLSDKPIEISEKYLELLWHDFLKPEARRAALTPKSIGGATGGASRGCTLLLNPVTGIKSAADTIFFSWRSSHAASYIFTLRDNEQNELLNIITKDTSLTMLKKGLLKEESDTYNWSVKPGNDKVSNCETSGSFTLTSLNEKEKQVNEIVSRVASSSDVFAYNLKVSEQLGLNGWYEEAFEYYQKARASLKGK